MKTTVTVVTDDLDGSPDAETHLIELNGQAIEIDLGEANTEKLYDLLDPYFEAGRRLANGAKRQPRDLTRERRQRTTEVPPAGATQTVIREWWKKHPEGLPTWQAKGRLPAAVMRAWEVRE